MRKILALGVLAAISGAASATQFTLLGTGLGTWGVNVTYHDSIGTNTMSVFAGELKFLYGSTPVSTACVSLRNVMGGGASWDTAATPVTMANPNLYLAGKIFTTSIAGVNNADKWTGLQLAIWKAIYDGSNLSGTNFIVNSGASTDALNAGYSYYLAGIGASSTNAVTYGLGKNGEGQPQIGAPVPEPASMAALGVGALGLVRRRRRSL